MADLTVKFGGMKMRNPIGIAPLNPAIAYARDPRVQADWLLKHVDAGAGYVFVSATRPQKSSPNETKPSQKFMKVQCKGFAKREGLYATGDIMAIQFYLDKTLEVMSILKKELPDDIPLIAQPHVAGPDLDEWTNHCKLFEEAGADALELNFCPISLASPETSDGSVDLVEAVDTVEMRTLRSLGLAPSIGDIPDVLPVIVKECVDAVSIPVGLKPSAEAGFPKCVALAKLVADAGAAWVANITSPLSIAPPDIYDRGGTPWKKLHFPINPFAGAVGPWDRYHCYKNTVTISMFVPEIDIMALGGIVNPEHSIEMIMLGAKIIGLSSGFFWKGRGLLKDSLKFLNRFMDEQGYETLEEMRGIGLQHVRPVDESIEWNEDTLAAKVDKKKCSKCGICSDAYCPVPIKGDDGFPIIDEVKCQGCGMCIAICPTEAISLERL